MNSKANLYMALGASLMVFTVLWAQNHRVIATYSIGSDTDQGTFVFDVLVPQDDVAVEFDVFTAIDTVITVSVSGPNSIGPGTQVNKMPDPNGWVTTFQFVVSFTTTGTQYVDVTVQAQGTHPVIRAGRGIVRVPMLDPNYDYTLAMVDPREYQKAVKVTHRYQYLQGLPIHYTNILELMP